MGNASLIPHEIINYNTNTNLNVTQTFIAGSEIKVCMTFKRYLKISKNFKKMPPGLNVTQTFISGLKIKVWVTFK